MESNSSHFDVTEAIEHLRHYLPAQAALKDFVHHNTLHAFQSEKFHDALSHASNLLGYATYLSFDEYRSYYKSGKIRQDVFENILVEYCTLNKENLNKTKENLLSKSYLDEILPSTNILRSRWKASYNINMDKSVHPILFRLFSGFLDQGISIWKFPTRYSQFLDAVRYVEKNNMVSIFKTKRARALFLDKEITIEKLLDILVGDSRLYFHYLFDLHFAHSGWSGFISVVENQPSTLLSNRKISLKEIIILELSLEIDALDKKYGSNWKPLSSVVNNVIDVFSPSPKSEAQVMLSLWQEAFEWSYFDEVLSGIKVSPSIVEDSKEVSFQGLFCIDDREYSFRRHIELVDKKSDTYGTPGFFGVEFYFQPEHGKFFTKACPAPVNPVYLIKEKDRKNQVKIDYHFSKKSHGLFRGWLYSNILGFWSAIKLFFNVFKPTIGPATAYSFAHMDKYGSLEIDSTGEVESNLNIGFKVEEMALRVKNTLRSIGLTKNFARIVYMVGHGGTSVNNPYYAGYDCGACCGRPGAVNARVFSYMANKKEVREMLRQEGLDIPDSTVFIGGMHDTTRDEIEFYEGDFLSEEHRALHSKNTEVFKKALQLNAQERAFRFDTIDHSLSIEKLHSKVKERSVSLFEPRPEWNHTANALCIIGRKPMYSKLYLDKRPFINSYDYSQDLEGKYLLSILGAAVPVCGGINLEYYFSRVDQQKLGSGTKLPHNVVGLFGLANGVEGDLLPGLPSQMIEIHDPVRILFIIEHYPSVVQKVISSNPGIYEWIKNEWVLFSVKDPDSGLLYRFKNGEFKEYIPLKAKPVEVKANELVISKSVFNSVLLIN